MSNKQSTIIVIALIAALCLIQFQEASACILKSEITLEDMGLFTDGPFHDKNGNVVGFKTDFTHADVPCDSVGQALDSGYTIEEIQTDLIRNTPLR